MGHRAHSGRTMPWHAEEAAERIQEAQQHNVPMQAGPFSEHINSSIRASESGELL